MSALSSTTSSTKLLRVLVGDSEEVISDMLGLLIASIVGERQPIEIVSCSSLDELLTQAGRSQFDICFLSLNNLLANVSSATERIAKMIGSIPILRAKGVRYIVTMTHFETPEIPDQARAAGADAFLRLPFTCAEFKASIRRSS